MLWIFFFNLSNIASFLAFPAFFLLLALAGAFLAAAPFGFCVLAFFFEFCLLFNCLLICLIASLILFSLIPPTDGPVFAFLIIFFGLLFPSSLLLLLFLSFALSLLEFFGCWAFLAGFAFAFGAAFGADFGVTFLAAFAFLSNSFLMFSGTSFQVASTL